MNKIINSFSFSFFLFFFPFLFPFLFFSNPFRGTKRFLTTWALTLFPAGLGLASWRLCIFCECSSLKASISSPTHWGSSFSISSLPFSHPSSSPLLSRYLSAFFFLLLFGYSSSWIFFFLSFFFLRFFNSLLDPFLFSRANLHALFRPLGWFWVRWLLATH